MIFFLILIGLPLIGIILYIISQKPSNDHHWAPEVSILPSVERNKETITLRNIRRFRYSGDGTITEDRFDRTINLNNICGVDLFIERFSSVRGPAHSILSFQFTDGNHIAVSVEVRRRYTQRESSFWLSIFRQYGLFYVVADEEDVIYLRSHIRKDPVYLHPLRLTPSQSQKLFLETLPRIDGLQHTPELYALFSNTCATNIYDHLNTVLKHPIPFHWSLLLPAFLPAFLYQHQLIATDLPFLVHQAKSLINEKPELHPDLSFSEAIRQ